MRTRGNHNRTTGAQDHTRSKTDVLEGFLRRLEALRGKYTLLTTKLKYESAMHVKQAYNKRLTIQAKHPKDNRRNANYIYNILIFCQKVSIFWHLKKS